MHTDQYTLIKHILANVQAVCELHILCVTNFSTVRGYMHFLNSYIELQKRSPLSLNVK